MADVTALIAQLGGEWGKQALAQLVQKQNNGLTASATAHLADQIVNGGVLPKIFEMLETDVTNEDVMKLLFNLAKEKVVIPKLIAAGVLQALRSVCERWPPGVKKNPNCNHISVISKISVAERTEEPMVTSGLHVELLRAAQDEQTTKSAFNALLNIAFARQCKQPLLDIGAIPAALALLQKEGPSANGLVVDTGSSAFKFLRSMSLHTPCFPVFVEAGMIGILKANLTIDYKDEQNIWFISNLSDVSDACLMFCEQGFLPLLKVALADFGAGDSKFRQWALTAVWRMARVTACRPCLLENHMQDNLLQHTKLQDEPILAMMGLALLVGREEEGRNSELIQTDRTMIAKLVGRLSEAVAEYVSGRSAFVKTKATVLDYLTAIGCVAVADVNKALMTTIEVLGPLLDCADKCRADTHAVAACADILLELTFSDAALKILQQERHLSTLKDVKNWITDQQALHNLDALLFRLQPTAAARRRSQVGLPALSREEKKHATGEKLFVSYHNSHQVVVSRLVKDLQDQGHSVWFDVQQMQGTTAEGMAEGLETSNIVLMDISPQYKESANCRFEGMYAMQLGKRIIPLMFENEYKATGWLGSLLGNKKWYPAWNEKSQYDELLKSILREVGGPPAVTVSAPRVAPPPPSTSASRGSFRASEMTIEDVTRWLRTAGLADYEPTFREAAIDGCGLLWLQQHSGALMATGRGAELLSFLQSQFGMKIGHAMRFLEKLKEVK